MSLLRFATALVALLAIASISGVSALYEEQAGLTDWSEHTQHNSERHTTRATLLGHNAHSVPACVCVV